MRPRLVTPNACVAITRRTVLRKAFVGPWAGGGASGWDEVGQTFAYAAALAQRSTGIDWHQLVLNTNHHHSQATPRGFELAEATRVLHRTMAGALNTLLRLRGFDAPGSVWDKRQTHWRTLVDAEAVASRLVYDDVNCVAAGWVAHPLDVPFGHHLGFEHWTAGGLAVPKPDNPFFSKRMPAELELRLTPPIALVRAFEGDVDAVVAAMSAMREEQLKGLAAESVRGVAAMCAVHPWDEPDSEVAEDGDSRPFAVGAPGEEGRRLRAHCKGEVDGFLRGHDDRVDAWKKGDRTSPFPAGTLRGHTFLGMKLDVPGEDAVLCAPFPSREEVEAEMAEKHAARARLEAARRDRARARENAEAARGRARRGRGARARARRRAPPREGRGRPAAPCAGGARRARARRRHTSRAGCEATAREGREAGGSASYACSRGRAASAGKQRPTRVSGDRPVRRCAARFRPEPRVGPSGVRCESNGAQKIRPC